MNYLQVLLLQLFMGNLDLNTNRGGDMKRTAKDKLKSWLQEQKYQGNKIILTSSILSWGSTHFSNRAGRDARVLREEGFLRRIPREELLKLGVHGSKELAYEVL